MNRFKLWSWQLYSKNYLHHVWPVYISETLGMDCAFIKYPKGAFINWHKDPLPFPYNEHRHYRLNIVIKQPEQGGMFAVDGEIIWASKNARVVLFRPDLFKHKVDMITEGERLVLSFGKFMREGTFQFWANIFNFIKRIF